MVYREIPEGFKDFLEFFLNAEPELSYDAVKSIGQRRTFSAKEAKAIKDVFGEIPNDKE